MAKTSLEAIVWPKLGRTPQLEELESFLGEFPDGMHSAEARTRADKIRSVRQLARAAKDREQRQVEAWNEARNADTKDAYEAFLKEWPDSPQAKSARRRLRMLQSPRPNVPEWLVPAIVTVVLLVAAATAVAMFVWPPETKTSYDKLAPIPPNGKNPLDALVPNIQIGKTLSDTLVPSVANGKNLSNDQAAPVPNQVFSATPGIDVAPAPPAGKLESK
jgi:hypothetical protein